MKLLDRIEMIAVYFLVTIVLAFCIIGVAILLTAFTYVGVALILDGYIIAGVIFLILAILIDVAVITLVGCQVIEYITNKRRRHNG